MTILKFGLAIAGATAMTIQPALAQSAANDCMTSAEAQAGIRALFPILIEGTADGCQQFLPADAYLTASAKALAGRYAPDPDDDARLQSIVQHFDKKGELKGLSVNSLKSVFGDKLKEEMTKDLNPQLCSTISKAMALLDPLPAENMIGLIELIAREIDLSDARKEARIKKSRTGSGSAELKTDLCPVS